MWGDIIVGLVGFVFSGFVVRFFALVWVFSEVVCLGVGLPWGWFVVGWVCLGVGLSWGGFFGVPL